VNNNLFTNVMARYNLEQAVAALEKIRSEHPDDYAALVTRLALTDDEVAEWRACAAGMTIPFDEGLGIHPQDDFFLDREVWDLSQTPDELRPLLLHYHPLVIYRFQVLKQADVVLALFLQGDRFTPEEKRADFEYYDPITTGDSTLSAVVQSIIASEVGYHDVAVDYFLQALYVDLKDLHGNTVDGLHVASTGGVWSALVFGFGGMRDRNGTLSFDPRLPAAWPSLTFPITWRGSRLRIELTQEALSISVERAGEPEVRLVVRGEEHVVSAAAPLRVRLADQGDRIDGLLGNKPILGGTRSDGTRITAGVPEPIAFEDLASSELEHYDVPPLGPNVTQR
jgi:alpha,alpha-trehalose phosphorylase